MLTSNSMRWLVVVAGAAMLLAVAAACSSERQLRSPARPW